MNINVLPFKFQKLKEKETYIENTKWIKAYIYKEIEAHELSYDKNNIRDFIDMFIFSKAKKIEKDAFTGLDRFLKSHKIIFKILF